VQNAQQQGALGDGSDRSGLGGIGVDLDGAHRAVLLEGLGQLALGDPVGERTSRPGGGRGHLHELVVTLDRPQPGPTVTTQSHGGHRAAGGLGEGPEDTTGDATRRDARFERRLKLTGDFSEGAAGKKKVTASCADGVLVVRVEAGDSELAHKKDARVSVSGEAPSLPFPSDDAEALGEDEITLLKRFVPGFNATNFEVTVTDGSSKNGFQKKLTAVGTAKGSDKTKRVCFATSLPNRLDVDTIKAFVVDGVLTVTAATPLRLENRDVTVRSDEPASLPPASNETAQRDEPEVLASQDKNAVVA
jgi:HSP20 family molecular chaperone IbpA